MSTSPSVWLVVRLGAMGDVLLTTGVLEYWRKTRGWRFIVLTKEPWSELFHENSAVERVISLLPEDLTGAAFVKTTRRLARDYAGCGLLDLHGTLRSRLLAAVWRGPVRRYKKMSLERRLYQRLRCDSLRRKLEALTVPQRYAMALEQSPPNVQDLNPLVRLREDELAWARERLRTLRGEGRPLIALHPMAAHRNKAWPERHWLALTRLLHKQGWGWYQLGHGALPGDLAQAGGNEFVNNTTPRQSAALLACSDALVSGDSGPMHLGVAVDTPTVALFGPTAKVWGFFPPPPHRVLEHPLDCRPCSLHGGTPCSREGECMRNILPEDVLGTLREVMHERQLTV